MRSTHDGRPSGRLARLTDDYDVHDVLHPMVVYAARLDSKYAEPTSFGAIAAHSGALSQAPSLRGKKQFVWLHVTGRPGV